MAENFSVDWAPWTVETASYSPVCEPELSSYEARAQELSRFNEMKRLVSIEFLDATDRFEPFNSAHEGYAVLLEEVNELWEEVKKNPAKHPERAERMKTEAIQVAAMAFRFLSDVC